MKPLTYRQRWIIAAVHDLTRTLGYPPSRREIGIAVGLRSCNTVNRHLWTLASDGWLEITPDLARSVRLGLRVATSRDGQLAEVITTFSRCDPCGMDVPSTHLCPSRRREAS